MYSRYSESLPAIYVNAGLIHLQHKLESSQAAQDNMTLSTSRQQFLACEPREGDLQYDRKGGWFVPKYLCCLFVLIAILVAILTGVAVYFASREISHLRKTNDFWSESDPLAQATTGSRSFRLPSVVVPSFYRLKLVPNLEESFFRGEVYITLRTSSQNIDKIVLHSKNLNISDGVTVTEQVYETLQTIQNTVRMKRQLEPTNVSDFAATESSQTNFVLRTNSPEPINDISYSITTTNGFNNNDSTLVTHSNTRDIPVVSVVADKKSERLTVLLGTPLKAETNYILQITFSGHITESLNGFYKSNYVDVDKQTKTMAITQFEPTYARSAFPCFDEPQFKAMFEISIAHRDNVTALSNMPVASTEPMTGNPGWSWTHFDRSVKMSTYLVAYGIVAFKYLETTYLSKDSIIKPIRVWCRPEFIENAHYAIKIAPKLLEFYEDLFGLPYVLKKLDLIAVPDFSSGAMENWGLITFRETTLLYNEKSKVARDKQSVAVDVAHELAHQWFGNLVTMSWWTDLWLNEGFATYVEYIGTNVVAPELNMLDSFTRNKMELLRSDALKSTSPVSRVVLDASEISQKFDEISYEKGSSLIRMLNHTISEKLFHKGLVAYLNKWKYANAEENDLWASMSEATRDDPMLRNVSIETFMDTWTKQTGYPVVTATRDYSTGDVVFTQTLFTTMATPFKSRLEQIWQIPVSYASIDTTLDAWDTAPKFWLNQRETVVNIPLNGTQALYVNVDSIGYYRVNYDPENWKLLSMALNTNWEIIPHMTRAQLLDDAFNLAKVGQLPYQSALDLTTYLMRGEDSRTAWDMVLGNLAFLKFTLRGTPYYGEFQDYILAILKPVLKKHNYGLNTPRSDEEAMLIESLLLWECYAESPRCLVWAQRQFESWMNENDAGNYNNPIPSNLRGLVYTMALRYGGRNEFDFLWRMYENSTDPTTKETIVGCLASTRDESLIRLLLERSMTVIPPQYAANAWSHDSIAGSAVAQEVFVQQWRRIHDKYSKLDSFVLGGILAGAFNYIASDEELQEFKNFVNAHTEELKPYRQSILKLVDAATLRIRWVHTHAKNIAAWFTQFNNRQRNQNTSEAKKSFPSSDTKSITVAGRKNSSIPIVLSTAPPSITTSSTESTKISNEVKTDWTSEPKTSQLSNDESAHSEIVTTFRSTNAR